MSDINTPFTAVQIALRRRMWLLNLAGIVWRPADADRTGGIVVAAVALIKFGGKSTPAYGDDAAHFMYGSIGAETHSGLPYWLWKTLPQPLSR